MLITKEVLIYKKPVKIGDLSLNSHKIVVVKCDNCGKEKKIRYQLYNILTKNNTEDYYCNNKECINKKRTMVIQKKYGVDNVFQLEEIKEKIKVTNMELYGAENPQQNKEIKNKTEETNLKKYGVRNPFQSELIKEKMRITNKKNLGFEFPSQSESVKDKKKITSLKNYGFEYPIQNKEFFNKHLKNGFMLTYIDCLSCQGSYEKHFVLEYKDKIKIENGLSISYEFLGEKKIYHSDYYLPDYDLVVEIKSSYWYKVHQDMCKAKEKYTKKRHNYIMILDKNYNEFDTFIKL